MINYNQPDEKSAIQAQFDAQKIAFGPIVFQGSKALRDMGILDLISQKKTDGITALEISEQLELPQYGVKVLLEVGLSSELLRLVDDKFILTKTGYFLIKDELTRVNMNFVNDVCYQGMFSLQDSIQSGKPTGLSVFGNWDTIYEALSSLPKNVQKSWFEFDHYYSDNAFPQVLPVVFRNNPKSIVDVGGNTGRWAICCAEYSNSTHITIVDLPGQLKKALLAAKESGYSERITAYPLDLLQTEGEFPEGADVIWMSQFLDCFSEKQIEQILSKASKTMKDNTSLYIMETYWNRQRFEAAAFCLHSTSLYFTNMANGNSKMYHSDDMKSCIARCGMRVVSEIDDIALGHTLFECKLD